MKYDSVPIIKVLRHIDCVGNITLSEWDVIVRQARTAKLLGYLYFRFEQADVLNVIPERVRSHFYSGALIADRVQASTRYEVNLIMSTLSWLEWPIVFLKGAAYVLRYSEQFKGRVFSDVDILVEKKNIERIEKELLYRGWEPVKSSSYDQKYYRLWMHELPPLTNKATGTSLDVHHNILPETARFKPDANKMIRDACVLENFSMAYTLNPIDMLLHSAAHLFHEGELEHGLRDLMDLDTMFRHFATSDTSFWQRLVPRANELDLMRPLFYAVRYTTRILETPIPENIVSEIRAIKPALPKLMDFLFDRALMPDHSSANDIFTGFARWALYVRSHYLRMPLYLLVPHLIRKAVQRRFFEDEKNTAQ